MFYIRPKPNQRRVTSERRFKRQSGLVTIPKTFIRPSIISGKLDELTDTFPSTWFLSLRINLRRSLAWTSLPILAWYRSVFVHQGEGGVNIERSLDRRLRGERPAK